MRLGNDGIRRGVRDRAAGRDRRQSRSPASTQSISHAVVKEKRLLLAAIRIPAVSQQGDDFVECRSGQVSIGRGSGVALIERIHVPFLSRDFRDDLLGQDVFGVSRNENLVQVSAMNRSNQRGAFHKLVTGRTQQPAFWNRTHPVA